MGTSKPSVVETNVSQRDVCDGSTDGSPPPTRTAL